MLQFRYPVSSDITLNKTNGSQTWQLDALRGAALAQNPPPVFPDRVPVHSGHESV